MARRAQPAQIVCCAIAVLPLLQDLIERTCDERFLPAYLVATFPPIAWIPILALAGLFIARPRRYGAWMLLLSAAYVITVSLAPGWNPPREAAGSIRVMQLNAYLFQGKRAPLLSAIARADPDVICIEEASAPGNLRPPRRFLSETPQYRSFAAHGMLILTKGEILGTKSFSWPQFGYPNHWALLEAEVRVEGQVITVFAMHLFPRAYDTPAWPKVPFRERVDRKVVMRRTAIEAAVRAVRQASGPVVFCTDLNSRPCTWPYRALTREMDDAWTKGGFGFGFTSDARFGYERIDHMFVRGLDVHRAWTMNNTSSDHLAVIAEVSVVPKSPRRTTVPGY